MSKLLAGRYELVDKIGEGGMAVVYKGKDRLLNRYVAIKILRPEYTQDEKFVENFKRESQAAAGLQHPNIVAVYDVGVAGSINFIVMELVEGKTLSEIIDEQAPMDYKVAIDYAKQMASALSLAHKNQIVHRDVKPHNILVTADGIAKLTDFGIARAVSGASTVTDSNKIIGSVHYFSPEQARGTYVDERSDIYSLGIVIYEMLTGKVPFDGDNPVEVALKHINEDIVPPSKLVKGIPPNLERLVMKATDKFQTNRYKSADEMLEDLTSVEFVTNYLKDRPDLINLGMTTNKNLNVQDKAVKDEAGGVSPSDVKREGKGTGASGTEKQVRDDGRNKRLLPFIILGLIVLFALVGIYIAGRMGGKENDEVKVPGLLNMTYEEAKSELAQLGLNISRNDDISSDDVEMGLIAQQIPAEGSNVKPGKIVEVRISSGPGEIEVPDVKGRTFDEAKLIIEAVGLKCVRGETRYSDTVPKNYVLTTEPEASRMLKPGETIVIIMSDGPEAKTDMVPNLHGMQESQLKDYLNNTSFELGNVTEEESESPNGTVIKQTPVAGDTANKGTKIDVVISKEITDVEVPSFTGKTLGESESIANQLDIKVVADFVDDPTGTGIKGTVIGQSVEYGTRVKPGTVVTLRVIRGSEETEPVNEPEPQQEPEPEPTPEPEPEPEPGPENNEGQSEGGEEQGAEGSGESSEANPENNGG